MSQGDTVVRGSSADGVTPETFIAAATCPSAVDGDIVLDGPNMARMNDGDGDEDGICDALEHCDPNVFLVNAWEIFDDDIGDEDGLCESDEACIYSPNFGVYQGEGDYLSQGACNFVPGRVSGVTMYGYPLNGG